ncbi:contact-dependent growth inhibition system immunity protein [Nevskia soli]|uniref:contact-dependent growth inhibition system immunity protein n=1 Tax=Nevskia soli TaxID=418856 RepID=UPI0004A6DEAB|nr:contact-dependent growth inhibition system immunity protein [Nevskia soli]
MFGLFKKRDIVNRRILDDEYEERQGKRARVQAVSEAIIVASESGRGLLHVDPDAFHCFLQPDADDATLGETLLGALAASRFLLSEEAKEFRVNYEQHWSAWVSKMVAVTGIKDRKRLFQRMASCGVAARNGNIIFTPTIKRRGEAWEGLGRDFKSSIPLESSPKIVGAALREALSKCVPDVIKSAQHNAAAKPRKMRAAG